MAITIDDNGRSLLYDALAQNDVDMQFHKLLNLDTSNLPPVGIPPTFHPPTNQWIHDWDAPSQTWLATQPRFADLFGNLTSTQMLAINQLGQINAGSWHASPITPPYLPSLDAIRVPVANMNFNGTRLTNISPPVDPNDAVTLGYMDFMLQGLQPKESCRVASTTQLGFVGQPVIDGVQVVVGDRVLNKNSSIRLFENGIYVVTPTGHWTRATDCDTTTEIQRAYVTVREGTLNAGSSWVQINPVANFGTDPVQWVLFSSAPSVNVIAGNGLSKTGNTLSVVPTLHRIAVGASVDIAADYAGQNSISTLGTITVGTWNADVLRSVYGGTGVNNNDFTLNLGGVSVSFAVIGTAVPDNNLQIRVPAGTVVVTMPVTGTLATIDGPETFTNKRINKRVNTMANNSAPTVNVDTYDGVTITAQAGPLDLGINMIGTPVEAQELEFWLKDNGTARALTFPFTKYAASTDLPLPATTTANMWLYLKFIYNFTKAKWVLTLKLNNIA